MITRVVLSPAAESDVIDAALWYEKQRQGLGEDFLLALEATLQHIMHAPEAYARIEADLRRAMIRRFPYGVFYSIEDDHIAVVAVMHASRDPE